MTELNSAKFLQWIDDNEPNLSVNNESITDALEAWIEDGVIDPMDEDLNDLIDQEFDEQLAKNAEA